MRRLVAGVAATAIVYVPLALWVESGVSPSTPAVALAAGITFAALAGTMAGSTRGWALRAVGLLLMLAGAAVLLLGLGIDIVRPLPGDVEEAMLDLVLSLWTIGVPLSLFGVVLYWLGGDRTEDERRDARDVSQNQREREQTARDARQDARARQEGES